MANGGILISRQSGMFRLVPLLHESRQAVPQGPKIWKAIGVPVPLALKQTRGQALIRPLLKPLPRVVSLGSAYKPWRSPPGGQVVAVNSARAFPRLPSSSGGMR